MKMRLLLAAQMKHKLKALLVIAWVQGTGLYTPLLCAAGDDVTIRVIGLDEVPSNSLRVIELPDPDLGEIADINENILSETPSPQFASPPGDSLGGGGAPAAPEPPVPSTGPVPQ